jgi:outer membrane protein OmpA-like peptidoglycan-associated protein
VVDAAQATSGKPGPKSLDGRVIVKEGDNRLFIQHDEDARFRIPGAKFGTMTAADGTTITTINRPDGSQIVTITDKDGNLIRRTRKLPNGQVIVLIDRKPEAPDRRLKTIDYFKRLPPIVLNIPRQDYVVESQRASPQQLQLALQAPPVEMVERPYSLDEIRQSERLRDKVRRIDVDTVTFEFGQAAVPPDQVGSLAEIGRALAAIIRRDPGQVYLIEGHTDAVGTDIANLALSDRRAESVADILTAYYDIPAENLVTQGYGEQYLKIPTEAPERQNRRVTVRNITPLLKADNG